MAIVLATYVTPEKIIKSGDDPAVSISAGQSLKIETAPDGEEVLSVECPAGKSWSAKIIVEITETDA